MNRFILCLFIISLSAQSFETLGYQWDQKKPLKVFVDKKTLALSNPEITVAKFKKAFKQAFNEWNFSIEKKLSLKFVKKTEDANVNVVYFLDPKLMNFVGFTRILEKNGTEVQKVEINISGAYDWYYKPKIYIFEGRKINLYTILLHELGHVFGLAHTTLDASDMPTMNKFISTSTSLLSDDDREGIRFVYSNKNSALRRILGVFTQMPCDCVKE